MGSGDLNIKTLAIPWILNQILLISYVVSNFQSKNFSDFGGDSYDLTIGLGIVTSGIGTLKRDDVKYSGSSVSGYQISSFFTQQRGLWEAFLGLSFQGKYYYDLRSSESGLIHDRRVNWVNFLIGLGIYY